jgi:hypothetical protein
MYLVLPLSDLCPHFGDTSFWWAASSAFLFRFLLSILYCASPTKISVTSSSLGPFFTYPRSSLCFDFIPCRVFSWMSVQVVFEKLRRCVGRIFTSRYGYMLYASLETAPMHKLCISSMPRLQMLHYKMAVMLSGIGLNLVHYA